MVIPTLTDREQKGPDQDRVWELVVEAKELVPGLHFSQMHPTRPFVCPIDSYSTLM